MKRWLGYWAAGWLITLSACGGGGGGEPTVPPKSVLPAAVDINGPAAVDLEAPVGFSSSAAELKGLNYQWQFGDGDTSIEASPKHQFRKAGDYAVKLTVSDDSGQRREATLVVSISNKAHLSARPCTGTDRSGWCRMAPLPFDLPLNQVSHASATTGWVLASGRLFLTTDAGQSWQSLTVSGAGVPHSARVSANGQVILLMASDGQVWRSRDGGTSFVKAGRLSADLGPAPLQQAASAYGVTASDGGRWVSIDDGDTWQLLRADVQQLAMDGTVWGADTDGAVWSSTDLGLTQRRVSLLPAACIGTDSPRIVGAAAGRLAAVSWFQTDVRAGPAGKGVVVTDRPIVCTSGDGGATWRVQTSGGLSSRTWWSAEGRGFDLQVLPLPGGWVALTAPSAPQGGSSTGLGLGKWLATEGTSWQALPSWPSTPAVRLIASAAGRLLLAGATSWISDDQGRSWRELSLKDISPNGEPAWRELAQLGFFNLDGRLEGDGWSWSQADGSKVNMAASQPLHGYASAVLTGPGQLLAFNGSSVARSRDGGRNWTSSRLTTVSTHADSMQFASAGTGWLIAEFRVLLKSTDGGQTWAIHHRFEDAWVQSVRFRSETAGLAVLMSFDGALSVWETQDGGATWARRAALPQFDEVKDVQFLPSGDALLIANSDSDLGGIYMLKAGGSSVARISSSDIRAVKLRSLRRQPDGSLWVSAEQGVLFVSTDGGQTWQRRTSGATVGLNAVVFVDGHTGWAVGDAGTVLATQDGGLTWKAQTSGSQGRLSSIAVQDSKTVWLFGDSILATGTGGR